MPMAVGVAFTSWGDKSYLTIGFVILASIIGFIQLLLSLWALVYKWDDQLGYSLQSLSGNRSLFEKYKSLASAPPEDEEAEFQFKMINVESQQRSRLDEQQGVTEEDHRIGMRAALRQLQKACAACKVVPTSMKPSDCAVCGDFKIRRI